MDSNRNFRELIQKRWDAGSNICVGLDPELGSLPAGVTTIREFNEHIVKATAEFACAFKPNIAFYEALGTSGLDELRTLVQFARSEYPAIPFICDAKRCDNSNSNRGYIHSIFDLLGFDAITVHPYMGQEALHPFLERAEKGIIVLTHTSNPGAAELQQLEVSLSGQQLEELSNGPAGSTDNIHRFLSRNCSNHYVMPLYRVVALKVRNHWNLQNNCGLVAGATFINELATIRQICDELPLLIPGVGAQGGDIESVVPGAVNSRGDGMIISSTRAITNASTNSDYADAAHLAALKLNAQIQSLRHP